MYKLVMKSKCFRIEKISISGAGMKNVLLGANEV